MVSIDTAYTISYWQTSVYYKL